MAKHTNEINERVKKIIYMECEILHDISEDLDELMGGDDIEFEKPIKTKRFDVHGITYMTVTDKSTDTNIEVPAFCINEHLMIPVVNAPYEVALMTYRTVLDRENNRDRNGALRLKTRHKPAGARLHDSIEYKISHLLK